MRALGQQTVGQTDCFHGLAVIDGAHLNPGFMREMLQNGFGIHLVLGRINDDKRRSISGATCQQTDESPGEK